MKPRSPLPETRSRFRRTLRWLTGGALLFFAPKCVLCALAYAGAAAGLAGPELCGGNDGAGGQAGITGWLFAAGALVSAGVLMYTRCRWRAHDAESESPVPARD